MEARLVDRAHPDLSWWVREREREQDRLSSLLHEAGWQFFVCYKRNKSVGFRGVKLHRFVTWPGYTYCTGIVGSWSPRVALEMVQLVEKELPENCMFAKWTCDLDNHKSYRLAKGAGYTEEAFQDFWFWEKELRYRPAHNLGKWIQ